MFKDAKVGDRVWDFISGWGTINNVDEEHIGVIFDKRKYEGRIFSIDGLRYDLNTKTLFWDKIKFDIPEKPFNLENELRKLEKTNFINEGSNCMLAWDSESNKAILMECVCFEIPNVDYFTKKSIEEFVRIVKYKNVTKEEFFNAYKKVFG